MSCRGRYDCTCLESRHCTITPGSSNIAILYLSLFIYLRIYDMSRWSNSSWNIWSHVLISIHFFHCVIHGYHVYHSSRKDGRWTSDFRMRRSPPLKVPPRRRSNARWGIKAIMLFATRSLRHQCFLAAWLGRTPTH